MSNQLQITGGAKVRNLQGVITGTSGVLGALGINVPDGIPQLDGSGKILVSQLPNSVMEYKGTWNVATNTPYLVDGVGNAGDVYIVTGAATGGTTHNFGAGPILFYNGDQAIYDGSLWQRASGSTGSVTSVAMTTPTGLSVTGSPITTSGTLALSLSSGYIIPTTSFLNTLVPYTGATQDVDLDTHVLNAQALHVKGTAGAGHLGLKHQSAAATGSANESLIYANVDGDLAWKNDNLYLTTLNTHANTADRTYTFPNASGTLALTSDLSSYVPTSRTISTTAPLQGGGDLSANRTLSITQASASTNGYLSSTDWNTFNNKQSAITNPVTGVGSADSVAYWNSSSNITYDSTFYYSSSNKRLGVNTNTPNATIGANIAIDGGYGLLVKNADNNYNGLGIGIDSTYGNLIASQKLGTASARNVTILNQSGYHSLTEAGSFGLNILTPTASPSGVGSVGIDVYGGSNAAGIGFHNVASGVGNTNGAYIYLTNALSLTLRNLEGSIVSSSLGDFSVITNSTENFRVNASTGSLWQSNITSAVLKANSSNVIVAAVAGTDYQAPITLTTSGSSGAATFSSNTLNVPNYTLSGLGGVPTSRTLTINGTAYDLSADRSWSVGTLTGGGADGRVAFWNGASNVVSDSLFVWDDTNNRLGIGLVNPQRALEIYSASPDTHLRLSGAAPSVSMGEAITGSIYQAKFGLATASNQFVTGSVAGDFVINNQTGSTIWAYNSTEKMRLDTNGNLGVGGIANSSYRLHVFGTGTMLGIETTAASNVYLRMIQAGTVVSGAYYNNSDTSFRIFNNNGGLRFDTSTVNGALTIAGTGAATFSSSVGATGAFTSTGTTTTSLGYVTTNTTASKTHRAYTDTSGNYIIYDATLDSNRLTIASTGAATFSSTITAGGQLSFSAATSQTAGSISRNSTFGLTLFGIAGSTYDFGLVNKDGNEVMAVPTGTQNAYFFGKVGIGTTPSNLLDVLGGTSGSSARIKLTHATSSASIQLYTGVSDGVGIIVNNNPLWFDINGAERIRITSGGNIGLGDTGSSNVRFQLKSGGNTNSSYAIIARNSSSTDLFVARDDGAIFLNSFTYNTNTTVSAANMFIWSGYDLGRSTSSRLYKTEIEDVISADVIYKMRPVWYRSLCEKDRKDWSHYGFIAEEMAEIEPRFTHFDEQEDGTLVANGVQYDRITALLVKALQDQKNIIDELSSKVTELENKLK